VNILLREAAAPQGSGFSTTSHSAPDPSSPAAAATGANRSGGNVTTRPHHSRKPFCPSSSPVHPPLHIAPNKRAAARGSQTERAPSLHPHVPKHSKYSRWQAKAKMLTQRGRRYEYLSSDQGTQFTTCFNPAPGFGHPSLAKLIWLRGSFGAPLPSLRLLRPAGRTA